MRASVPDFKFLAPLVTEIWRGSKNKNWELLLLLLVCETSSNQDCRMRKDWWQICVVPVFSWWFVDVGNVVSAHTNVQNKNMKQHRNRGAIGIYYTRNENAKRRPNRATCAMIYFSYFHNLSIKVT